MEINGAVRALMTNRGVKKVNISVTLPVELIALCKSGRYNVSQLITFLLTEYFSKLPVSKQHTPEPEPTWRPGPNDMPLRDDEL